jgi:predicted transcriptional regulator
MKKEPFMIPRRVFHSGLSLSAIGLYIFILDEKCKIVKSEMKEKTGLNTFKFNKTFKELQEKGFIKTTRIKESGRFDYIHEIIL